jgi:anti-anti-sigma factor
MTVEGSHAEEFHLAVVRGEIDIATSPLLREALDGFDPGPLVVSLEDVAYCDSTGLSALIAQRRARDGRVVVVVPPTGAVRRLFEVAGLERAFAIVQTRAEAPDAMRAALRD